MRATQSTQQFLLALSLPCPISTRLRVRAPSAYSQTRVCRYNNNLTTPPPKKNARTALLSNTGPPTTTGASSFIRQARQHPSLSPRANGPATGLAFFALGRGKSTNSRRLSTSSGKGGVRGGSKTAVVMGVEVGGGESGARFPRWPGRGRRCRPAVSATGSYGVAPPGFQCRAVLSRSVFASAMGTCQGEEKWLSLWWWLYVWYSRWGPYDMRFKARCT